jgi:hypothetical protein
MAFPGSLPIFSLTYLKDKSYHEVATMQKIIGASTKPEDFIEIDCMRLLDKFASQKESAPQRRFFVFFASGLRPAVQEKSLN